MSSETKDYSIDHKFDSDKIKGLFTGIILGDALGIPYEFSRISPKIEYSRLINQTPFTIQWQFAKTEISGCSVSDDTEMTLALLKSLVKNKKYDKSDVILSYEDFANNTKMLGRNTRKLFKGIKTVKGYYNRFNKLTTTELNNMQSNGCLMRASPLIFCSEEDIRTDVYLSNPNEIAYYCVLIFVSILKMILCNKSKTEIKEYCKQFITDAKCPETVQTVITDSFNTSDTRNISGDIKGWICSSLYIALYTFWNFDTFDDAVHFVIYNRPKTDTDTNASILCSLMGCYLGFDKINSEKYCSQNIKYMNKTITEFEELFDFSRVANKL